MTRHLIFDLDGTLVDSAAICCDILSGMLRDRGSDRVIDVHSARHYMSHGGRTMISALLESDCGNPDAELAEFRHRYTQTPTPVSALFPGVAANLDAFHRSGYTLSICSNKPQYLCEKVLQDTGVAPLFSTVVGSREGLNPKPAPDLLDDLLRKLDARANQCLFIGDSELDYEVAVNAGISFLFVTYGYAAEGWLPNDSHVFDDFSLLSRHILTTTQRYLAA